MTNDFEPMSERYFIMNVRAPFMEDTIRSVATDPLLGWSDLAELLDFLTLVEDVTNTIVTVVE